MNVGGLNAVAYQEELCRQRAAAQVAAPNFLTMSVNIGIMQPDGRTIDENATIYGTENAGELNPEVVIQANHFTVPVLWRSWLRKCKLLTICQIGAACTIEGLKDLFSSAQRSENLIASLADQANILLFQATCINMNDMVDAPDNSQHHEKSLQGLKSNLDLQYAKKGPQHSSCCGRNS